MMWGYNKGAMKNLVMGMAYLGWVLCIVHAAEPTPAQQQAAVEQYEKEQQAIYERCRSDRQLTDAEEKKFQEYVTSLQAGNKGKWPREGAVFELGGEIGHERCLPILTKIIKDPKEKEQVRIKAILGLSKIQDNRIIPILIEMLEDSNQNLRFQAYDRLWVMTGQRIGAEDGAWKYNEKEEAPQQKIIRQRAVQEWRVWWEDNKTTFKVQRSRWRW